MKVKAKTTMRTWITEGKEYEVLDIHKSLNDGRCFQIKQDDGHFGYVHRSHFTVIEEQKPEITAGSEWVSDGFKGEVATVKYVGEHKVFIKWRDGSEGERFVATFHENFKPKPKTVTMYFYNDKCGLHARELDFGDSLFKREIEL